MKKAIYKITTENGNTYTFTFEECYHEETYGNGNYIAIYIGKELTAYVDMRYTKYVFETFCASYIRQYYGENLLSFERVE